jgi:hypothetical protein
MSDTPRTDAAVQLSVAAGHNIVCPNFARQLERELAEAKKDTARLDWLADPKNTIGNVTLPRHHIMDHPDSMRAAIDAAMEGEK